MYQNPTIIPEDIKDNVYQKFIKLPLKNKLIIYSKLLHGNSFKPQNNDLFGLNRRSISKIFRLFIETLKENTNVVANSNSKSSKSKKT